MSKKEQNGPYVGMIENGVVIDHIPVDCLLFLVKLLNPLSYNKPISIANCLASNKMGKKGILKIADRSLSDKEMTLISVLAPEATLNIICNFKVVEKPKLLQLTEVVSRIPCPNSRCITSKENITSRFLFDRGKKLPFKCFYCQRSFEVHHLNLYDS